jgi:hypothetical protein
MACEMPPSTDQCNTGAMSHVGNASSVSAGEPLDPARHVDSDSDGDSDSDEGDDEDGEDEDSGSEEGSHVCFPGDCDRCAGAQ